MKKTPFGPIIVRSNDQGLNECGRHTPVLPSLMLTGSVRHVQHPSFVTLGVYWLVSLAPQFEQCEVELSTGTPLSAFV